MIITFFLRNRIEDDRIKRASGKIVLCALRGIFVLNCFTDIHQYVTLLFPFHMNQRESNKISLHEKYPPSQPCSCETCLNYCKRPGWWTVEETELAIHAGYANRMMLEISPERDFGVLSPSFKGNEGNYAFQVFSGNGCTFLKNDLCELYGTEFQPLECRYCHHERIGSGEECHFDIEKEWNSEKGKRLIVQWGNITGFWQRQHVIVQEKK